MTLKAHDHQRLVRSENSVREGIEGLWQQMDTVVDKLKQIKGEMV